MSANIITMLNKEDVIETIGFVVSSHVMCRASLSKGSGRYEEVLTADIGDLFDRFKVLDQFCEANSICPKSNINLYELNKQQEGKLGADFIISIINPPVFRNAFIQAKRQDYNKLSEYAKATNYEKHHKNLKKIINGNSYWAWYHSDSILSDTNIQIPNLSYMEPSFKFSMPEHGNKYYFHSHPKITNQDAFIEPSSYRSFQKKRNGNNFLAEEYAYGIMITENDDFDSTTFKPPTVKHVVENGRTFQKFLLDFFDDKSPSNYHSHPSFDKLCLDLKSVQSEIDKELFNPQFIVTVIGNDYDNNYTKKMENYIKKEL